MSADDKVINQASLPFLQTSHRGEMVPSGSAPIDHDKNIGEVYVCPTALRNPSQRNFGFVNCPSGVLDSLC
jgi:hypothetical protein